jgi:hypothetical protein
LPIFLVPAHREPLAGWQGNLSKHAALEGKMKGPRYAWKIVPATLLAVMVCGCTHGLAPHRVNAVLGALPESAKTPLAAPEAQEHSHGAMNPTAQAPGLVVHIDPLTGEILPKAPVPPAGQALDPQQLRSAPVSPLPLVEMASPTPGGGIKVKLNRQFHQPLFATIDGDGKIKFDHRPAHSGLETE